MNAKQIAQLFSKPVSVSVATPEMYDSLPYPEELAAVARAVERRRKEFAAGRACARQALAQLGVPPGAIRAGPDRAPIWPDGYVGSITHCEDFCCAVVAPIHEIVSIGVDAEDAGPLTSDMVRVVLRPDEVARFAALPNPSGSSWAKLAFSAKEAIYKCYHPLAKSRLDFHDVSIHFLRDGTLRSKIDVASTRPEISRHTFDGRWRIDDGRVYVGVVAPIASS